MIRWLYYYLRRISLFVNATYSAHHLITSFFEVYNLRSLKYLLNSSSSRPISGRFFPQTNLCLGFAHAERVLPRRRVLVS
jgi:hypothetical protein